MEISEGRAPRGIQFSLCKNQNSPRPSLGRITAVAVCHESSSAKCREEQLLRGCVGIFGPGQSLHKFALADALRISRDQNQGFLLYRHKVGVLMGLLAFVLFVSQAHGQYSLVPSIVRCHAMWPVKVSPRDYPSAFLQVVETDFCFVKRDRYGFANFNESHEAAPILGWQQGKNLKLLWLYLLVCLLPLILICQQPFNLGIRRLHLAFKLRKLRFETIPPPSRGLFSRSPSRPAPPLSPPPPPRAPTKKPCDETRPKSASTRPVQQRNKKKTNKKTLGFTGSHIACEPQPNLKQ